MSAKKYISPFSWKPEQKKFIGNAVECHMSQALCEALANELNR